MIDWINGAKQVFINGIEANKEDIQSICSDIMQNKIFIHYFSRINGIVKIIIRD